MRAGDYLSPWWPGDLERLSDEQLTARHDAVGRAVLEALDRCDPVALEQGTVTGDAVELLELSGPARARRELRETWNAWRETRDERERRAPASRQEKGPRTPAPIFGVDDVALLDPGA